MVLASDRPSLMRRNGRLLCGAKTRAGGRCRVRAEPGKARCRFHGASRQVRGRRPVVPALPRPSVNVGTSIGRGLGRSTVRTKSGLKGRYSLAETCLVTSSRLRRCRDVYPKGEFLRPVAALQGLTLLWQIFSGTG